MNALRVGFKGFGLILLSLFLAGSAWAAPNLSFTAFVPAGWSAGVVLTTNATSTTYGTNSINSTNNLYVSWSLINAGTTAANNLTISTFVDGLVVHTDGGTGFTLLASNATMVAHISIGTPQLRRAQYFRHRFERLRQRVTYLYLIHVAQSPIPTLLTPVNGSIGQSENPTFTWSAVPGSTGYRILVATNKADLPTVSTARAAGPSAVINATTIGHKLYARGADLPEHDLLLGGAFVQYGQQHGFRHVVEHQQFHDGRVAGRVDDRSHL